jgi:hypothetical protein
MVLISFGYDNKNTKQTIISKLFTSHQIVLGNNKAALKSRRLRGFMFIFEKIGFGL